jgi:hypothetical protein
VIDRNDPTVREMEKTASDNGLVLRFIWAGAAHTDDWRSNRVNAHLAQGGDGRWRVSNKFEIG